MTTFCLVHGAWHDDACWAPLVTELEHRGHVCLTPVPPLERHDATFEDYAKVVVDALTGVDAPVVVGHSISSAVVPLVALRKRVALLVYTRDDGLFDDRWSRWICRELLGIEPVELPGGHFPMLERSVALAALLEGGVQKGA